MTEQNVKKPLFQNYGKFFNMGKKSEETEVKEEQTKNIEIETTIKVEETKEVEGNTENPINSIDEDESYKPVNRNRDLKESWKQGCIKDGPNINFRKEPSVDSGVICVLSPGDEILIQDIPDSPIWTKVKFGSDIGYVMSKYIIAMLPSYVR